MIIKPINHKIYKPAIILFLLLFFAVSCTTAKKTNNSSPKSVSKAKHIPKRQEIYFPSTEPDKPLSHNKQANNSPIESIAKTKLTHKKLGFSFPSNDPNALLYNEAAQWIGVPYKYGGNTKKGVDCSGVTCQIYKSVYSKTLQRRSADMAKLNVRDIAQKELSPGDLVFFATSKNKNTITHVGIYLKNNYFIHASSKVGVVVNNLNEDYYKKNYKKGGRVK